LPKSAVFRRVAQLYLSGTGLFWFVRRLGALIGHLDEQQTSQPLDVVATAPPGTPADGDTYIPAATATGAWAGHEEDWAINSQWVFGTPCTRWVACIEDEAKLSAFAPGAWSAGLAL
jgi:hypothetical protein